MKVHPPLILPRTRSALVRRLLPIMVFAALIAVSAEVQGRVTYATSAEVLAMFPKKYTPSYPYEARRARMQGSGVFRMYIDENGVVTRIGVLKSTGHKLLDVNASYGLIHWRAKPGRRREVDMPVTFTMEPPRRRRA